MKIVLISGTFAPITIGHADIIGRAAGIFDGVRVVVFNNSEKNLPFTIAQRFDMVKLVCDKFENAECDMWDGLLAEYMRKNNITTIVRGVRNMIDYSYEMNMYLMNKSIDNNIETVFLPSKPEYQHVSSSAVREFLKYNVDIKDYVTEEVNDYIKSLKNI